VTLVAELTDELRLRLPQAGRNWSGIRALAWQVASKRMPIITYDQTFSDEISGLSSIRLERFKAAFKPTAVPLGAFTVVIGRNGSGKSTLLEALQWLDATIRRDAREASDRYFGVRDLINLRSRSEIPFFELSLSWSTRHPAEPELRYRVRIEAADDNVPVVAQESLGRFQRDGQLAVEFIRPLAGGDREVVGTSVTVRDSDRLALGLLESVTTSKLISNLVTFWERAVFLRLSPNRLAGGSRAKRRSFDPLLDEEGQSLAALLHELPESQRAELTENLRDILEGIRGVEVTTEGERDERANYSLLERMPYRGRSGRKQFPIPAWMLSEGTRRVTAILALLVREPAPSLICIEEIENGLDPWTIREVLRHLQSAADRGTQIILTTHSPWLLDEVPLDSILQVRRIEGDTKYERFAERDVIKAFGDAVPAGTRYVNSDG
jgi:predicted ATPase